MRLERGFVVDGKKLTDARFAAGLSLDQVASKLGCNKGNISRWERGKIVPTSVFILKMVLLYGRFDFVKREPLQAGGGKDGK